ncbi:hypothetical protein ACFQ6O_41725 [Streptomyces sp. NPDC056441]|uniref:hypothetical protein n=1 Tax=Streptomyces sp. NPDC056441 TaxID=3345817 RepID=UPI0036822A0C
MLIAAASTADHHFKAVPRRTFGTRRRAAMGVPGVGEERAAAAARTASTRRPADAA